MPLSSVTTGIDVAWEDNIIARWNRRRAITVQCSPDGAPFGFMALFGAMSLSGMMI